jgi:hypothetical protein
MILLWDLATDMPTATQRRFIGAHQRTILISFHHGSHANGTPGAKSVMPRRIQQVIPQANEPNHQTNET